METHLIHLLLFFSSFCLSVPVANVPVANVPVVGAGNVSVLQGPYEGLNDAVPHAQWYLAAISTPFWIDTKSGKNIFRFKRTEREIYIYVVDSGIRRDHVRLKGLIKRGNHAFLTPPLEGHGTQMASAAVGKDLGVAPDAFVVDVSVCNEQGKIDFSHAKAIEWALMDIEKFHLQRSSVIHFPWAIQVYDAKPKDLADVRRALERAAAIGVPVVTGAGNLEGAITEPNSELIFPANDKNTFTVGAYDKSYKRWPSSCTGRNVDIWAPGDAIMCASSESAFYVGFCRGTSEASALVAGVMAYLLGMEGPRTATQLYARVKELARVGLLDGDLRGAPNRVVYNGAME